jgi:exosome complex RNA-binding protein Rrp42 (RNase PH superfamily)
MAFYKKWVDFVSFPLDSEKCYSSQQRLDLTNAVSANTEDYTPEKVAERGIIVTIDQIIIDDDEFEEMQISNYGHVIIWTKKRVWYLQNQGNKEKLIFISRHPQYSHFDT